MHYCDQHPLLLLCVYLTMPHILDVCVCVGGGGGGGGGGGVHVL